MQKPKKQDGCWDEARTRYAAAITNAVRRRNLTQKEAGLLIRLKQSDVSNLKRGRLDTYSLEKLIQVAERIGLDTELKLVDKKRARPGKKKVYASSG
jgi:predicted XRE-type DNA-binding protein